MQSLPEEFDAIEICLLHIATLVSRWWAFSTANAGFPISAIDSLAQESTPAISDPVQRESLIQLAAELLALDGVVY